MPVTIDQQGDVDFRNLKKYVQLYDMPEFAKSASYEDIASPEEPNANLYADTRQPYQFPCHTKAATYISYIYFLENKDQLTKEAQTRIQSRLDKLADFHGIRNFINSAAEKCASLQREDLSDSDFALVWVTDGNVSRHYPLRNAGEVKAAAAWFSDRLDEIRSEYVWEDRSTIATKILDKAAEYGADISNERDILEKSAGLGVCDPKKARVHIHNRALLTDRRHPELKQAMEKLASMIDRPDTLLDPSTTHKMAQLIDHFDRHNGLVGKYTDKIPAPEDVLFSASMSKVASAKNELCALTTGSVYDRRDFSKLPIDLVKSAFGEEILDEVVTGLEIDPVKFAAVASTFPRPDAEVLDTLMRRVSDLNEIKFASVDFLNAPAFISEASL